MFYNQPLSVRFGTELIRTIDQVHEISPFWDTLDIAVAWVRASGMAHLSDSFKKFLKNGGRLSIVVGIDLLNTTREGLQALLDLEGYGHCETFVYHNEAGSIFHPKLYLFRNEKEARLVVGSNNITASGLYINVEAGLQMDTRVNAPVITQTVGALESWKDTATKLAVRLDQNFLNQMVREGYVSDEAAAVKKIKRAQSRRQEGKSSQLFARRRFVAPQIVKKTNRAKQKQNAKSAVTKSNNPAGTVLLMRLRKASNTQRRTQTQIPIRVADIFFQGASDVWSAHSGERHKIIRASARGALNTLKLEIPEMRDFDQPVARFERSDEGIVYEVYDASSAQGDQILGTLKMGLDEHTTQHSISNLEQATWWRFI